jgi:hypothetical protein
MVNKQLVDCIQNGETRGYSSQQLYSYLVQQGYNLNEVKEAIDYVNKLQNPVYFNKKIISIVISAVIVSLVVVALIWFITRPVCNNNQDCNDNDVNTIDACINPSIGYSKCINAKQTELRDIEEELAMNRPDSVSFILNNEEHFIEIQEVTETSVTIAIYSEPNKYTFKIGQYREIDVDNDGIADLYVKLIGISNGKSTFEIKSLYKYSRLELEIISSKNTYQMAETVSGEFKMDYSSKRFNAIVLYTYTRDSFDKKIQSMLRGNINTIGKMKFNAFRIDEYGHVIDTDFFYDEGNYHYTLSVYSCESITTKLNEDCFKIDKERLMKVVPLKTVTKTIKVQGGVNPSECRVSEDCIENCVGCGDGTQICEQSSEKCIDCFMDTQCKSGYKCRDNSCVEWQCDENIDCNDNDVSTKDTCSNFKCTYAKITECEDNDLYCPESCNSDNDNDCTDKCGSEIIDCGATGSMNGCFINAARNCCPAKIITGTEINFFNVIIHSESYREIKGPEAERCIVYQRTDDYYYDYPGETRQRMLDIGMTEEEIAQQLAQQNEQAQEMIGKDGTCSYPFEDLINKLKEEKQVSFLGSTEDIEKYRCVGLLYEQ